MRIILFCRHLPDYKRKVALMGEASLLLTEIKPND
jgi:hypothetical protein